MPQKPLRLSILIPCHSRTPWFADTLDSILGSGYHFRDTEIVICDDASPDGGDGDTARAYAARRPELIRVLRNPANCGITRSLDRLHAESRGEYVMFFDSDDIFLAFDIDANLEELDRSPDTAAIYGKKREFSRDGDPGVNHGVHYSASQALTTPTPTPNAMIVRSADIAAAGGIRCDDRAPDCVWDLFLWLRLGLPRKLVFDNRYRLLYRAHPDQNTRRKAQDYRHGFAFLRQWLTERHPEMFDAMCNCRTLAVPPEHRMPFAMLAGFLIERGELAQAYVLNLLRAVIQMVPDDYSARMCLARVLAGQGQTAAALAEYFNVLLLAAGIIDVELRAYRGLLEVCTAAGMDTAIFAERCQAVSERCFAMTPAERDILLRSIERFRQMETSAPDTAGNPPASA